MSDSELVRSFYEHYYANADRAFFDQHFPRALRKAFDRKPKLPPADARLHREMQRRFEDVVAELDEGDQEIIVMRQFKELTNRQVARALKLTERAASMRYLRAMGRLREKFASEDSEE